LLVSDSETHAKIVIRDVTAVPDIAVLDPNLTISLSRQTTILAGVEAFVAKGSQTYSQALAIKAIQIIYSTLPKVIEEANNIEARGRMLVGSNLAGMAFAIN